MLKKYSNVYQLSDEEEIVLEKRRNEYKSGIKKALKLPEFRKLVEKKILKK
jgi:hypothetical protein